MNETQHPNAGASLTAREWEIAALVSAGKPNPEIANALCVSATTVHTHLDHIFKKLGLHGKVQLALWYANHAHTAGTQDRDGGELEGEEEPGPRNQPDG